jgi:hypothetical protein
MSRIPQIVILTSGDLMEQIGLLNVAIAYTSLLLDVVIGVARYTIIHVQVVLPSSLLVPHVAHVVYVRIGFDALI